MFFTWWILKTAKQNLMISFMLYPDGIRICSCNDMHGIQHDAICTIALNPHNFTWTLYPNRPTSIIITEHQIYFLVVFDLLGSKNAMLKGVQCSYPNQFNIICNKEPIVSNKQNISSCTIWQQTSSIWVWVRC